MGIRGMKLRFFNAKRARDTFAHGESRATLLDTLLALAILGLISVASLGGPATTSRAAIIVDGRVAAESLAQSQMVSAERAAYVYETAPEIVVGVLQHDGPTDVVSWQVSK